MGYFWEGLPEYVPAWAVVALGPNASFIETGTFLGRTAITAAETFARVDTIELDPQLHADAAPRLRQAGVNCHLGDSRDVLPEIIAEISAGLLVWLDAHYSGGATAGEADPCPIFGELDVLLRSCAPEKTILAIDDARLFIGAEGYPRLDEVSDRLTSAGWAWIVIDDVLFTTSACNIEALRTTQQHWRQWNSGSLGSLWPSVVGISYLRRKRSDLKKRLQRATRRQ